MSQSQTEHVRGLVDALNRDGGLYHRMELGPGLVVKGEYDMTKYIHHYGIPDSLLGRSVLDIGTASGFFAFECARRGGSVTAIDLQEARRFDELREALGLNARYVQKNLYQLNESFGQFDFVICGSVLLHLADIFGAIRRIRTVCKHRAILATAILDDPERTDRAYCEFLGASGKGRRGLEYATYWRVSPAALAKMLLFAGFSEVTEIAKFSLNSEADGHGFSTPHVVMRATV